MKDFPRIAFLLIVMTLSHIPAEVIAQTAVSLGSIDPNSGGIAVPTGFVGLSMDYTSVTNYIIEGTNFSNYFKNITLLTGAPNLRVGGNEVDQLLLSGQSSSTYNYYSNPSTYITIKTNALNTIANFQKSNNINITLGINAAGYNTEGTNVTTANATNQIAFVRAVISAWNASGLSTSNPVIELGNESDIWYDTSGRYYRDSSWTASQDLTNLTDLSSAIHNASGLSGIKLAGPAYSSGPLTTNAFVNSATVTMSNMATSANLSEITLHHYPHSAISSSVTNLTQSQQIQMMLLGAYVGATKTNSEISLYASGAQSGPIYSNVIASASSAGTPLRIGEMNSYANGGLAGVSDSFASALWAADSLASYARAGLSGVNIFSVWGSGYYNVFDPANGTTPSANNPLIAKGNYYGMYFFALAAQDNGTLLTNTSYTNDLYLATQTNHSPTSTNPLSTNGTAASVYYFVDANANLRVMAINRSDYAVGSNYNLSLSLLNQTHFSNSASLLLMADSSTNLADTNAANYQIGGQTFNPTNGLINSSAFQTTSENLSGGQYSFVVPAGEAGILTIMSSDLNVGYSTAANISNITSGTKIFSNTYVGNSVASSNNLLTVANTNTLLTNSGDLVIGISGSSNSLVISNGGFVANQNGWIGSNGTSSNNSVLLTGSGSQWSNIGTLTIGYAGNGTLTVANSATVNASGGFTLASQVGSSGTLNIGRFGTNDAAGTIVTPTITFGSGTGVINFNQANTETLSSMISGQGSIMQSGAGTTILTGSNSGFTGSVIVTGGTLAVNGQNGSASVTVASGGTLAGQGGTLASVTVQSGGFLRPSAVSGTPSILSAGALLLNSGATTTLNVLNGNQAAGSGYDQIKLTGSLTYNGTLSLNVPSGSVPYSDTIFNFETETYSSDFTIVNLTEGVTAVTMTDQNHIWRGMSADGYYTFTETTGILALTTVPEPSNFALLVLGLLGLMILHQPRNS